MHPGSGLNSTVRCRTFEQGSYEAVLIGSLQSSSEKVWIAAKQIVGRPILLENYNHILDRVVAIWPSLGARRRTK
jgi:hypothetical protein